jgi:hypothetical protein
MITSWVFFTEETISPEVGISATEAETPEPAAAAVVVVEVCMDPVAVENDRMATVILSCRRFETPPTAETITPRRSLADRSQMISTELHIRPALPIEVPPNFMTSIHTSFLSMKDCTQGTRFPVHHI